MKIYLTVFFAILCSTSYAQSRQCGCATDSMIPNGSIDCSSKKLSNGSELYWQVNCKRVWLTLRNTVNKEIVLDEVPIEYYGYTFRLGFHLSKEYERTLLFRSGCPANGPCNFILVDKNTGKRVKEFGELIYDRTENTFYDFVIFFSARNQITLEYIDTGERYSFKVNPGHFDALIPEYVFKSIFVKENVLSLMYELGEVKIDLKSKRRITSAVAQPGGRL